MPEDFELPPGAGEWEVGFDPADAQGFFFRGGFWGAWGGAGGGGARLGFVGFAEDLDDHALEGALEVRCYGFDFLGAVVLGLEGVALRVRGGVVVFDGDAVGGDAADVVPDGGRGLGCVLQGFGRGPLPQHGALHLVEHRVVAAVDGVAAVDVRDDGVADLFGAGVFIAADLLEVGLLVRACVRAQHRLLVDVVGVCAAAARVVRGEAEHVEVLGCRYDWVFLAVVAEYGARELALDELSGDRQRVVLVEVQAAPDVGEDRLGGVGPFVCRVGLSVDRQRFLTAC